MKLLTKSVGVLGFLGPFRRNQAILSQMNIFTSLVKNVADLESVDALIIAGTEINALSFVLEELFDHLQHRVKKGMPLLLTGSATILLSETENTPLSIKKMQIQAYNNDYPRVEQELIHLPFSDISLFPAYFLRSPRITNLGKKYEVLSTRNNDGEDYVLIEHENVIACTFYPELSHDYRIHEYLLTKI